MLKGLELSRAYYEIYVKDMIHTQFPEYESRIAVGLAGHGSECLGFDDDLSKDHDFGPAVCLWLTDDDYDSIGERLAAEYDKLPKSFLGVAARLETKNGHGRVGVIKLSDFLTEHIGCAAVPERTDLSAWQLIPDNGAAAAVMVRFSGMIQEYLQVKDSGFWNIIRMNCGILRWQRQP